MKKIKSFNNFINEKLGVLSDLEEMADIILNDTISNLDKIKSWFKSNIFNKLIKDEKLNTGVKEFNYYINKIVKRNYPKFGRLYAIFI